jgi:hypothetical protein
MASVQKTYLANLEWSGGSYKDEEVYTILLTTPQYHNLLPAVCALVEIAGVQWMESPRVPHVSGDSLSEPSLLTLRLVSDTRWETLYLLLS